MKELEQTLSHEDFTIRQFREDPEYAAVFLNAVLEEGDQEELLMSLRLMTAAFGGMAAVAERAEINAKTLYRTLSAHGNPELRSLIAILKSMGMRLAIQPLTTPP
jgi:probable addiction module antidote protein